MNLHTILQIGTFPDELQSVIDKAFNRHCEEEVMRDERLRGEVGAILVRSNYQVPPPLLQNLPNLKIIATFGVGYDGVPLAAAHDKNIIVTNTPGVLDDAVSELAVGLLLALTRQIPAADRFVREGRWRGGAFALTGGLANQRIGIVGMGRIGRAIAHRLSAFGVTLAYCGSTKQALPYEYFPDVRSLADQVDILIASCPGGDATRHLINADVLSRLGPDGYLVNVSRGSVVDESALIRALENGTLRGAALDVFENEPLNESPLASLSNTLLTPHIGSATHEARRLMLSLALDNIHRVLDGRAALTPV